MRSPQIAFILGALLVLAAALGFVPYLSPPAPPTAEYLELDRFYNFLLTIFPVNVTHDVLHGFIGLIGLIAARRFTSARTFCRFAMWLFFGLVVLGAIPITDTLFGAAPIYGWDLALHGGLALFAAWGGYLRGAIQPSHPILEPIAIAPPPAVAPPPAAG